MKIICSFYRYVVVVALSTKDNAKLLQQLKSGFKRKNNKNKYQSKVMMQETKPYSDYLIDLRFQGVNRLFILSFENNGHRTGYWQCFLPTVEIKGYNIMIDGRNFFDQPVKSNLRTSERSKLFNCYFNKYYKTIAIDLSKKQEQCSKLVLQEI